MVNSPLSSFRSPPLLLSLAFACTPTAHDRPRTDNETPVESEGSDHKSPQTEGEHDTKSDGGESSSGGDTRGQETETESTGNVSTSTDATDSADAEADLGSETAEASSGDIPGCQRTHFVDTDIEDHPDWSISTWSNGQRRHSRDNVWVENDVLVLRVDGPSPAEDEVVCGEIVSNASDLLYGSFAVSMKSSAVPGTVNGFFYYLSDTSEIDIEILSQENDQRLIHFVIHENIGDETHKLVELDFDPSDAFHEYRFDWSEHKVEFSVDGQQLAEIIVNVPDQPGRLLLNHWSLGSPEWGGGPPSEDAHQYVQWIEYCEP